jgi:hypothetical protein
MVKAEGALITISGTPPQSHFYAGARGQHHWKVYASAHGHHHLTAYASAHHHHGGSSGVAYAPVHPAPNTVQGWQFNPVGW